MSLLVPRADPPPSGWPGWWLELRCGRCGRGAALPVPWLVREAGGGEVRLLAGAMPWLCCGWCGAPPETIELVDRRGGADR